MGNTYFSASEIATFVAALGVLVSAIGAAIVNIIIALKQGHKVTNLASMVADVQNETKIITKHVNGAATQSVAKIDNLHREIDQLKSTMAEMKSTAALLTQALTSRSASRTSDHRERATSDEAKVEVDVLKVEVIPKVQP